MFAVLGMLGRFYSPGYRTILQRCGPELSRHSVITGVPWAYRTIAAACVNVTVQYSSQIGTTPLKLWRNPGIIGPLIGSPDRS